MSSIPLSTPGYVYILTNPSMCIPGLPTQARGGVDPNDEPQPIFKVGATTNSPFERARQLTAQTAAAAPFVVAHFRACDDVNACEARCHERLDAYRVNDSREFFSAPLPVIIKVVDEVTGHAGLARMPDTPFAYLFATFPDDGGPRSLNEAERAQCRELAAELTAESVA